MYPPYEIIKHDLNNDNKKDLIFSIGRKTNTNIGFDDFYLIILYKNKNSYKLAYAVSSDLNKTVFEDYSQYNSETKYEISIDNNGLLSIHNKIWYSPNTGNHDIHYHFKNRGGKLFLNNYIEYKTHHYGITPKDQGIYKELNFNKKTILVFDSTTSNDKKSCLDKSSSMLIRKCLKIFEKTKNIKPNKLPNFELSDFKTFGAINWKKYNIDAWYEYK